MDFLKNLNLVEDKNAKSESYYCQSDDVVIDDNIIAWLKQKLQATSGNTVRICLHHSATATFHEMIIAHKQTGQFKPHKHSAKSESYHVIEGRLRVKTFDDNGELINVLTLGVKESGFPFMHRMPVNTWHSTEPDGDFVVFHESKPGPFVSSDNIYPDWKKHESEP
jgi:cupin fold WbuC family metalloprotein